MCEWLALPFVLGIVVPMTSSLLVGSVHSLPIYKLYSVFQNQRDGSLSVKLWGANAPPSVRLLTRKYLANHLQYYL